MKDTKQQAEIRYFIARISGVAPCVMRHIFTRGGCYRFHQILKDRFPEAVAYEIRGHCVSKVAGRYWDITGALPEEEGYRKLHAADHRAYDACYFDEVHYMCKLAQLKVAQFGSEGVVET